MRSRNEWIYTARVVAVSFITATVVSQWFTKPAWAGERKFLVMLANSPKEFPGTDRTIPGQPTGGLPSRHLIDEQYFDDLSPNIGSFAEYWEEISYGDVTIAGQTTDWISLPWALRPPLADPEADDDDGGAAPDAERISPTNYFDLDNSGTYRYGQGEWFDNSKAMVDIDIDGSPGGLPEHTFGSNDRASTNPSIRVWRPGERFIDMDGDGRWDGLDEANNLIDFRRNSDRAEMFDNNGRRTGDGRPDLLGPWIDLNGDGVAANASNECVYLADSDNDGNPDCCPDGPGSGCFGYYGNYSESDGEYACPATRWPSVGGTEIIDCNGNLINDLIDIASGRSRDVLPYTSGEGCVPSGADGIPDECQYLNHQDSCIELPRPTDINDPCSEVSLFPTCIVAPAGRLAVAQRCEFDDDNNDQFFDIVEPYENFLRRWDPCLVDPDADSLNWESGAAHWIKVYDPDSEADSLVCYDPPETFDYQASTTDPDHSAGDPLHKPSYIQNNYPGDYATLESLARGRLLWGAHDPYKKLQEASVFCYCADGTTCKDINLPGGVSIDLACPAGLHTQFDPPDYWLNRTHENAPGGRIVYSAKMQEADSGIPGTAEMLSQATPEPGTYDYPDSRYPNFDLDEPWYEQAWKDRYVGGPSHPLSGPAFQGCADSDRNFGECDHPTWPDAGSTGSKPNIPLVRPFRDDDEEDYDPDESRRYFKANRGGLDGKGHGWRDGCGDQSAVIIFETGPVGEAFVEACNRPILPEEQAGAERAPIFYDGWVEHDDLPSSKYHKAGDQRLGEVTSPFVAWYGPNGGALGDPLNPAYDSPARRLPAIWGEDRGDHNPDTIPVLDWIIPAAGPYAQHIHGNFGRDAGNQLAIEWLTWRTEPPFNNGTVWESHHGAHPYAGPSGGHLGFRDFNLDGLIDQGETRPAGSENYVADSCTCTSDDGVMSNYPFNRRRLLEDCVEVVDETVDFDDYVDAEAMNVVQGCGGTPMIAPTDDNRVQFPIEYETPSLDHVTASGVASGIVLLPPGPPTNTFVHIAPGFYPIHTEDGLGDSRYADANLPGSGTAQLSWHLFFHDLVTVMRPQDDDAPILDAFLYESYFSAFHYLLTWEHFRELWDFDRGEALENCPMSGWDIMAEAFMVHPNPVYKEFPCTEWISAVDLTTVLTPGVEKVLTLPPAEFVRDNSYYFLENENLAEEGERLYLWSAGSGFDEPGHPATGGFRGAGVLIMHTDTGKNPEADPPQQNTPPFSYVIVQADGLGELDDGLVDGQATCAEIPNGGDPWPGSADNTVFNCSTVPASRWNSGSACTGLEINDIAPDGSGGALVTLKWTPTSIPSLSFIDPPGGVSVPVAPGNVRYRVKFEATDVYGGTTIHLYYTKDKNPVSALATGSAKLIATVPKTAPGTVNMTVDWNIAKPTAPVADGRYRFFAKLVPGPGADGSEIAHTEPRAGRNNVGQGTLRVDQVDIAGDKARTETWTVELIKVEATKQTWQVYSTLSQPKPEDNSIPPEQLFSVPLPSGTGQYGASGNRPVKLTLTNQGKAFKKGDRWTFVTTGITPISKAVVIDGGEINEGPKAVITASRLSGPPPLTVTFSAAASTDPEGTQLQLTWDFGDGSPTATGVTVDHEFEDAGTFTVVLRATSPRSGLYDEASVDIDVTNNSPSARIAASPRSGPANLSVNFDASQSSDTETPPDELIYQWDFGDGVTVNNAGEPGVAIQITHSYSTKADGTPCTAAAPCNFTAELAVTDAGGKTDVDTVEIQVGNSRPIANVKHYTALQGPAPWTVIFNAKDSSDPDGDELTVDWVWGDGDSDLGLPLTGPTGHTDGMVEHEYTNVGSYRPKVTIKDGYGETVWSAVTVVVNEATVGDSDPRALFTIDPEQPVLDEPFTVNASSSYDRPAGDLIASYSWNWGDDTATGSGVTATHTYTQAGTYTITLVVTDAEDPPNTGMYSKMVTTLGAPPPTPGPTNRPPTARFVVTGGALQPNVGLTGETEFTFDASGTTDPDGDPLTFDWSFGDGTYRREAAPIVTHVYDVADSYVVRLTARDPFNLATDTTHVVTVTDELPNRPPVAFITTGLRTGPAPLPLMFATGLSYDPDGDPLKYTWSLGHGDAEIKLAVDAAGRWTADVTAGEATVCLAASGVGVFWSTGVACADDFDTGNEHTWIEASVDNGATLDAVFRTQGIFTVKLELSDGTATDQTGVENISVTEFVEPPPPGPVPPPDFSDGADSAAQRPQSGICGLGMLMGLFASLAGLTVMMVGRRRLRY